MPVTGQTFSDIADAIRSKTGKSGTMKITQMAEEIESIEADTRVTLTVTVTGVSGATVTATFSGGTALTATTNLSGVATLSVKPGYDYIVKATKTGYFDSSSEVVHVDAGGASKTLTMGAYPAVTITVTDSSGGSVSGLTVTGSGAATVSAVTNASGVATFTLEAVGTYTFTLASGSIPSGGSASSYTVTVAPNGTYNGAVNITYGFGFTIVAIAEGTADPYARCSYPASVTINGKTYTNSIPSSGFTEARGTSLNGWAVADNLCSKLIEGIRPVALNGDSWVTDGFSLTDSTGWNASYDWFTEFPFRWMAWYKTESTVYIIFSDKNENPDSTIFQDYAFLNNSNVRKPNMHIGCFDGTNTSNVLYSKRTGANPTVMVSITNFITYAKARGTDFDIITFYQMMYVTGLFITLYKTTDCQGYSNSSYGLGRGYVSGSSVQPIVGLSFDNNYGMYGNRSGGTSRVSFFWIHEIWGNIYDLVGGAKTDSSRRLMTQTGKVSSVTDSDFNNTALTPSVSPNYYGYVTAVAGGQKTGPFPTAGGGSGTTYYSDYCYVYDSSFPYWGGDYNNADYPVHAGLFIWYFNTSAAATQIYIGSRLSYKGGRT